MRPQPVRDGAEKSLDHNPRPKNPILALSALLLLSMAMLSVVPTVHAQTTSWSFNLIGRNNMTMCMTDGCAGQTNTVTGGGSFVTSGDCTSFTVSGGAITSGGCTVTSISAGGSYTITDSSGKVLDRGTWVATSGGTFYDYGGPSAGFQGGHLLLTVSATSSFFGFTFTDLPSTINCRINQPSTLDTSSPTSPYREGVTSGLFTMWMGGATLFHLNN